jgi:hypothetical protein
MPSARYLPFSMASSRQTSELGQLKQVRFTAQKSDASSPRIEGICIRKKKGGAIWHRPFSFFQFRFQVPTAAGSKTQLLSQNPDSDVARHSIKPDQEIACAKAVFPLVQDTQKVFIFSIGYGHFAAVDLPRNKLKRVRTKITTCAGENPRQAGASSASQIRLRK